MPFTRKNDATKCLGKLVLHARTEVEGAFLAKFWTRNRKQVEDFSRLQPHADELVWEKSFDDETGAAMHGANSVTHDDGVPFRYTLIKRGKFWVDVSDHELRTTRRWKSLVRAKKDIQKGENQMITDMLKESK